MVYLPVNLLKPDMVLARDVPSGNFVMPLIPAGQELTASMIAKILQRGVQGAYIESDLCDDITAHELVDPVFKQKMLGDIKREFDHYLKKNMAFSGAFFAEMASSLVMELMDQEPILLDIIDLRDYDNYTYSHSMYVGILSVMIGINLNLPNSDLVNLATCGLLHDIGKLDISLSIINKPSPLTEEEMDIMRQHPIFAANHLKDISLYPSIVVQGIQTHHEKFDGSGYPGGLQGTKIPLYGRILALADVYDALNANRPYRKAWSGAQIIDYMMSCSGTHFDPDLLKAFLYSVAVYPVGTFVKLSDGSIGVVSKNTPGSTLRPVVRILHPKDRPEINLAEECLNVTISGALTGDEKGLDLGFAKRKK